MAGIQALPLAYQSLGFADEGAFKKQYGYTGTGAWSGFNDMVSRDRYNQAYQSQIIPRVQFLGDQQMTNAAAYNEWAASPTAFTGNSPFKTASQKQAEMAAAAAIAKTGGSSNAMKANTTTNFSTTVNSAVPKISSKDLPDFLPANNNAQMAELKNLLAQLPGFFDTSALEHAYDTQIQYGNSVGQQVSGNAAREFINRQGIQGGDRSLGGLIRAQSMMPFLQQNAELTGKKEGAKMDAQAALAKITGDVSANLATLRTDYLKTLAGYTSNLQQYSTQATIEQQKQAEAARQFDSGLSLDQSKLDLQRLLGVGQLQQGQQKINQDQLLMLARLGLLGNSSGGSGGSGIRSWMPTNTMPINFGGRSLI